MSRFTDWIDSNSLDKLLGSIVIWLLLIGMAIGAVLTIIIYFIVT